MKPITLDTTDWPAEGNLTTWGRVLKLSQPTIQKYYKSGRLKGLRQINGIVVVTKEAVMACFQIRHQPASKRQHTLAKEREGL